MDRRRREDGQRKTGRRTDRAGRTDETDSRGMLLREADAASVRQVDTDELPPVVFRRRKRSTALQSTTTSPF